MKKTLFAIAACALIFASCNKKGKEEEKPLEANFTFAQEQIDLVYGEPVIIAGTIETTVTLDEIVLTAAKLEGELYIPVGEPQPCEIEGTEISGQFFPDSKDLTAVELRIRAGKKSKSFYLPASVTGEAKGAVWMNDAVALYPDNKVAHNVNNPTDYPLENTGAGSDTKSFFSMHGVEVGGKVEHILSLNELLTVDGKNASMCWLNVLEKTDAAPKADGSVTFIGSQRGYMFSGMRRASLGGGTTGRQCDVQIYDGKQIKDENIDFNFGFVAINGSWAGEKYIEDLYKLVDRIWLSAEAATTNLEQIKSFYALSEIQKQLDNSTLGVEENPTSLGGKTYLRRWAEAGHTSKKDLVENLRAGDYIIIRSQRGTEESPKYYYGIIQVLQLHDDSGTFVDHATIAGKRYIDQTLAYDLFMKPSYFSIKTQFEIL